MVQKNKNRKNGTRATAATLAFLAVGVLAFSQPAAAAGAAAINCSGVTWDWYFWPPLDLSGQQGVVDVYSNFLHNACPYAAVDGLHAEEDLFLFAGYFQATYVGDCVHATVYMPDGEIHIVGGTVITGFGGSNDVIWQMVGAFLIPACGFYPGTSVVNLSAEYVDLKDVNVAVHVE